MLLAGIFCKYLISLKSWKYWSQYSFIYLLTKGVKSTAAKWWRKEKSVMISDSGGARAEFTEQIASVMCECDQEAKCKTRRNARCMHVAPRCGPRWYNFTILIYRDHISREGTIQTFLFHGLFLAIFLSIIPFCGSVTRTGWSVGKAPDPFCYEHSGGSHVVTVSSHHVSHSWLWSGFNHPSDSADDTLSAPVKWKFNKISQQKK